MYASKPLLAALLLALAASAPGLAAEKKPDPGKEQIRRLQQAQHKLEQEKAQLAEEKSALEAELGTARKKADTEARRAAQLQRELAAVRTARDDLAARLADSEAALQKTSAQRQAAEDEGKRLQSLLGGEQQRHAACVTRNQELHKLGVAVLERYEKKTCLDSALQREPFTGLKRIDVDNAVEDLRDQLDSQRIGS